jgi:6-phosphogluconolactonase
MKGKMPISTASAVCLLISLLAVTALISTHATTTKHFVFFGTYTEHGSQGIYVADFDSSNGRLTSLRLAAKTQQPSFLAVAPNLKFLYAINELGQFNGQPTGAVSAFSIDHATGQLSLLNQVSSRGPGPAHIVLDRTAANLLVANYDGGSIAVFHLLLDGRIGESTAYVQHHGSSVNHERQEAPHAHAIVMFPDNRFAIVADLGLDKLLVYPFDASQGTLGQPHTISTEPGVGPRHLTFSLSGKFLYVVNELRSTVTVYSYDPADAAIAPLQSISTLPTNFTGTNTAAEIALLPSGKSLYASNRGDDNSIAVFAVNPARGTLTLVQHILTAGKIPRNFAIDPSGEWLLAANQDSNNVVTFRIDKSSGRLTPANQPIDIYSPAMVDFVTRAGGK